MREECFAAIVQFGEWRVCVAGLYCGRLEAIAGAAMFIREFYAGVRVH